MYYIYMCILYIYICFMCVITVFRLYNKIEDNTLKIVITHMKLLVAVMYL